MLFVVLTFALMVASINQLTSVPIGVWDVKLEIMTDRLTDQAIRKLHTHPITKSKKIRMRTPCCSGRGCFNATDSYIDLGNISFHREQKGIPAKI